MKPAPIWTINPMSNVLIEDVPLRLQLPGPEEYWDSSARMALDQDFYRGRGVKDELRPEGLFFVPGEKNDAWMSALLSEKLVFAINSMVFVSREVVDALCGMNLGNGRLTHMPIYQSNRTTVFDVEFYLLEYSSTKDTVDRDNTVRCRPLYKNRPEAGYRLTGDLSVENVYVRRSAAAGADIWFDPKILHYQFVSDRFAQPLLRLGLRDVFKLNQCKFLTV